MLWNRGCFSAIGGGEDGRRKNRRLLHGHLKEREAPGGEVASSSKKETYGRHHNNKFIREKFGEEHSII